MKVTEYISGSLRGTIYEFTKDDMHIHWHSHEENQFHNVIVLKGAVLIEMHEKSSVYLFAGDHPLDFDGRIKHKISAVCAGTTILNLLTHHEHS